MADTRGAAKLDPPLRPAPDPPSCLDAHLGADDARPALRGKRVSDSIDQRTSEAAAGAFDVDAGLVSNVERSADG